MSSSMRLICDTIWPSSSLSSANSVGWLSNLLVIAVGHLTSLGQCGNASDGLINELERSLKFTTSAGRHFIMIRRAAWSSIERGFLDANGPERDPKQPGQPRRLVNATSKHQKVSAVQAPFGASLWSSLAPVMIALLVVAAGGGAVCCARCCCWCCSWWWW